MPLRDHFHAPLDNRYSWEGFYGGWPAMMVRALSQILPLEYAAEPRVRLDSLAEPGEYEVRVYDHRRGRRQVAAIEIVSPANKDRPEYRRAFVAKCAALLQKLVSVTIVDLVTTRNFNLYRDLLELIGCEEPSGGAEPPALYAAACRATKKGDAFQLETWAEALAVGRPLPTLPLWLADNFAVPLELEAWYEDTCRALRIP